MAKTDIFVLCAVAHSADASHKVISKPIAAYRDEGKAQQAMQAESELNHSIMIQNREFITNTGLFIIREIEVPKQAKDCWVVWSNAFMQDGTGVTMGRLDGIYGKEEHAQKKVDTVEQGDVLINRMPAKVKTMKAKVKLL